MAQIKKHIWKFFCVALGVTLFSFVCAWSSSAMASPIRRFHQKEPVLIQQPARPDNLYAIVRSWQRQLDAATLFQLSSPRVRGQVIQADGLQMPAQRESVTP